MRDYDVFKKEMFHYWMRPTRKKYNRGFQEFAWDAALPQGLRIGLRDLGAVARVGGHGISVVAPLMLTATPFPSQMEVQGKPYTVWAGATTGNFGISPTSGAATGTAPWVVHATYGALVQDGLITANPGGSVRFQRRASQTIATVRRDWSGI